MIFRTFVFFYCFFLFPTSIFCKVIPVENSQVNYTTVYFEEDLKPSAKSYILKLYRDSALTLPVTTLTHSLPAFYVQDLNWNTSYYWKIDVLSGTQLLPGKLHIFRVIKLAFDTNEVKVKVRINNTQENRGELISIDYTRSVYNRNGKAVWTIPDTEESLRKGNQVRDLRITRDNTVTFLTGAIPYEIDLNAGILWSAPFPFIFNGDTIDYHHDFKKTNRGTYMVLGNRKSFRKVLGNYRQENIKGFQQKVVNDTMYCKVPVPILFEFDKRGSVIWFWDSNTYLKDIDLNYKKTPEGAPDFGVHSNAFSENNEGTKVYIGFRDMSRIVELDKAKKKLVLSYGERYPSGEAMLGDQLFRRQHDANVTSHNSILILNNNHRGPKQPWISSVMELKDNPSRKDSLVLWKLDLNFDTLTNGKSFNTGNVSELPNSNLLVCTGFLGRIFEVTRQKKELVWDAFVESKGPEQTEWKSMSQYRCNWIGSLSYFHFLVETQVLKKSASKQVIKTTVYNTGNTNGTYKITLMTNDGKIIAAKTTRLVKANETVDETFFIKMNKDLPDQMKVIVTSAHSNAKDERTIYLTK